MKCTQGLPDRGIFGYNNRITRTPINAVWLTTIVGILPCLLDLASPLAANAIFAACAVALDLSYIITIFLWVSAFLASRVWSVSGGLIVDGRRRYYRNHPEVIFRPGPFYMPGMLGWAANIMCISWVSHSFKYYHHGIYFSHRSINVDGLYLYR